MKKNIIYSLSKPYSNRTKTMKQLALECIHLGSSNKLFQCSVSERPLIFFPEEMVFGKTFLGSQTNLKVTFHEKK